MMMDSNIPVELILYEDEGAPEVWYHLQNLRLVRRLGVQFGKNR